MTICDKCGKDTGSFDESGVQWNVCRECRDKIEFNKKGELNNEYQKRPFGISIFAILMIIAGFLSIFGLVFLVILSIFYGFPAPIFFILIIGSLITMFYLAVGYGFLKGLKWSLLLGVIIALIGIINSVIGILTSPDTLVLGIIYLIVYGFILFYLTRPHVRNYFNADQPGDVTSFIKESKKTITMIVIVIFVTAGLLIWSFTPADECQILDIYYMPENPQPGDKITVIAEISGGSLFGGTSASCRYGHLGSKYGGGGTMKFMTLNKYSYTTHSISDGTEIWCMIQVGDKISEDHTIQVGHIERNNITSLAIVNVTQIHENLTTATTSVQINATVTSNVTISNVQITCFIFYPKGNKGVSNSMALSENNLFSYNLSLLPPESRLFPIDYAAGTKVFYRIKAEDESGNTAVTMTYSFGIAYNPNSS